MKRAFNEAFPNLPSTSDSSDREKSKLVNILFVCDEWNSSKGGLSTFNREFAINLAKVSKDDLTIHCYVCQSSESDREDARNNGVNIITAKNIPGISDRLEWLRLPPSELPHPDVVIGHGRKFGTPAYFITQITKCKWVQFVHVFCEDLGKYKQTDTNTQTDAVEENEKKHKQEIRLCKAANTVVAVGSRLQQKYSRCLPDTKVHIITPGILDKFVGLSDQKLANVSHSSDEFSVFVFGRGSYEDLPLKGYDIIANVLGSLGVKFKMTFVGSPEGQHSNIMDWFLQNTGITRRQLTVRGYCNQDEVKEMFYAADLVAMPSRTEGFGLIALEAISAGVPVLLTSESGIARVLEQVYNGTSVIVESEDLEEWSQKIRTLSEMTLIERLDTAMKLRESYNKAFPWDTQCENFKEIIFRMMSDSCCGERDKGQGVSSIHEKSVPVDIEDMHSHFQAVYDDQDVQVLHAAAENGNIEIIEVLVSQGCHVDSRDKKGLTPLMLSALNDEPSAFQLLLQNSADPCLKDNNGSGLLHYATLGENTSIMNKLLSLGLDVDSRNTQGTTPLMFAAAFDKQSAFQVLIENGADPSLKNDEGFSLLHCAVQGGNPSIINKLLSLGLDIDSRRKVPLDRTPLMGAAADGKQSVFELLIQNGADPSLKDYCEENLLHFAAQGGDITIINRLLSLGLDINSRSLPGETPLMRAAADGKQSAFETLIQNGADPFLKDNDGSNLLHHAANGGNTSIIDKLLSLGLDVNSTSSFGSPLMYAAEWPQQRAFQMLIQNGADPFLKDKDGSSLLHCAAKGGNTSIIKELLSLGLEIDSKDLSGKTPLTIATEFKNFEAVKFLFSKRACKSV